MMDELDIKKLIQHDSVNPLVKDYQISYLNDRKDDCLSMIVYLMEKNHDKFFDLAHQWIGTGEPYGFQLLAKLGKEIESYIDTPLENSKALYELIIKVQYYLELKKEML